MWSRVWPIAIMIITIIIGPISSPITITRRRVPVMSRRIFIRMMAVGGMMLMMMVMRMVMMMITTASSSSSSSSQSISTSRSAPTSSSTTTIILPPPPITTVIYQSTIAKGTTSVRPNVVEIIVVVIVGKMTRGLVCVCIRSGSP